MDKLFIRYSRERLSQIIIYIFFDIIIIDFSLLVAVSLWYYGSIPGSQIFGIPDVIKNWLNVILIVSPIFAIIIYWLFHMYDNLWKYASIDEVLKIFIANTLIFITIYVSSIIIFQSVANQIPKRMIFVAWTLNITLFTFSRFGYRMIKRIIIFFLHIISNKAGCSRVLVIGAGFAGYGVVKEMLSSRIRDKIPVLVIDSDPDKRNTNLMGIRVVSNIDKIEELVEKYKIDEIVITITAEKKSELRSVIEQCSRTNCALKILPIMEDITNGGVAVQKVRDVNITDLLFRDEIELDTSGIHEYISGKCILVTGGGGSIGSEICRQICKYSPKTIIIFDIYENCAYELMNTLTKIYGDRINILLRIGSIRDKIRLEEIFSTYNPDIVFHAAAHKHVGTMEDSPGEAVKNNVFGTLNTIKLADKYNVERFVMLSTDKAVNPTNVMGATKRISECLIQLASKNSNTNFMAVRFGNVLGSNGSVIPIFKKQIEEGGPITLTSLDVERYFMTIHEAVQLVLQAGQLNMNGRVMVLDMGEPKKILDIALNLIKLSGLIPYKDIDIEVIGLRNGEKMFEELFMEEEQDFLEETNHKKIFVAKQVDIDEKSFQRKLDNLYKASFKNVDKIEGIIKSIVPNYNSIKYDDK